MNHEQTHRARAVLLRDPDGMSDGESENGEAANARDLFAWLSREVRAACRAAADEHAALRGRIGCVSLAQS